MTSSVSSETNTGGLPAQMAHLARHYAPLILALVLLSGAAFGGAARLRSDQHVSLVSFIVQTSSGASDADSQIRTLQSLLHSDVVAADLVRATNVPFTTQQVLDRMTVSRPPGAGVLAASFSDSSADISRLLAEQLIPVFLNRVQELAQPQPGQLAVNYSVRTWGSGTVTSAVEAPPVLRDALVGLVLGALLVLALLAGRARRRPILLDPEQAARAYGLPLFGALTDAEVELRPALRALIAERSHAVWPDQIRSVLVLRSGATVGRAGLVVELAAAAYPGRESVVVDATDGGLGSLTNVVGASALPGVPEVLARTAELKRVLIRLTGKGAPVAAVDQPVWLLGAGPRPSSPRPHRARRARRWSRRRPAVGDRPALDGDRFADLIERLAETMGVVVEAAPDAGSARSWQFLARGVDAVLVVAEIGSATVQQAENLGAAVRLLTDRPAAVLVLGHQRSVPRTAGSSDVDTVDGVLEDSTQRA